MKNLRELFSLYHAGFQDFGPWLDHHREMHRRHSLDCAEFGAEWLGRWEAIGRLLMQPIAAVQVFCPPRDEWYAADFDPMLTLAGAIVTVAPTISKKRRQVRIVFIDGTIIREWGPK